MLSVDEVKKDYPELPADAAKAIAEAANHLGILTDDQRLAVMSYFCKHCGSDNPRCQCWNDE